MLTEKAEVEEARQLQQIVTRWQLAGGEDFSLLRSLLKKAGWSSPEPVKSAGGAGGYGIRQQEKVWREGFDTHG